MPRYNHICRVVIAIFVGVMLYLGTLFLLVAFSEDAIPEVKIYLIVWLLFQIATVDHVIEIMSQGFDSFGALSR
jgi:hypothetical protein